MGGAGFEPAKAVPPDLQSGPFGRLGIHPGKCDVTAAVRIESATIGFLSPSVVRLLRRNRESSSPGRAGGESRTHNRRFTKPELCRLSYASNQEAVKFPTIPSSPNLARGLFVRRSKSALRVEDTPTFVRVRPNFPMHRARERTRPRANGRGQARQGGTRSAM